MTLDLFDNVFGLNFALETAQSVLKRLTLLNSNLCQWKNTSHFLPDWLSIRIRQVARDYGLNPSYSERYAHKYWQWVQPKVIIGWMIRSYQGKKPIVPANCYVDDSAQVIGDVVLGERASVWMNAVVRGDVNSIRIGAGSNVQDCAVLHGMRHLYPVIVADMVTIGHNATVHGCVLEDEVLVGIGAVILNNARVGTGSIVAAGAVIPEGMVIPPRSLVAGVPGMVKRQLGDKDHELILQYARNYLDYVEIYLKETAG